MVAEAPSGGTEPGSEGECAKDSRQRPRRRRPPPFFYLRRFMRGPRPLNQQQPIEGRDGVEPKKTAPLEGDQQQGDERIPPPRFQPRQNTEAQLKSTPRPAHSRLLDSQESARGRRGPDTTAQPPTAQVLSVGRLSVSGWLGDSALKPGNHFRGLGYTARTKAQDTRLQASLRSRETQGQGLTPRARGPATWTG
ncbi:unnamed protein product [Rangifer tarandus platyrhynchus]|uniref:Uncharacterized protein n=1 Tax=Rangifer tarandus platyrhynchus TaxID=3082113 RepID=A0AC59ZMQ3_RANTA